VYFTNIMLNILNIFIAWGTFNVHLHPVAAVFFARLLSACRYCHFTDICYYSFICNVHSFAWDESQYIVNIRLITNN